MNYEKRIQAIQHKLDKEGADWFFVNNLHNIRYLSGYSGSYAMLLLSKDKRFILTDGRYQEQVKNEVNEFEPVIQGNRKELEVISETAGDLDQCEVWFECKHTSYSRCYDLQEKIPAKRYMGKENIVEGLRVKKDRDEIKEMKKALQIAERALEQTLPTIQEGMTERELAHELEHEMWKLGAEKEAFETLVLFGARSSLPHGKPSDNRLQSGDVILMDFGCVWHGYCSDITRTVFFGEPAPELKEMYELVLRANLSAEEKIKAGVDSITADKYARDVMEDAGKKDLFIHGLGHGLGLEVHESPRFSPIVEQTIEAGAVVTVEPGLYQPDLGGIRIEDTIVVKKNGCEVLNKSPKEMIVL